MLSVPLFTIVTPTYNCAEHLPRCLDSVLGQSLSKWEMVVVNNYSDDDTIDIVKSYRDSRIRLVNFRNHGIIAASRNMAIREGTGEFIAFLDADDWWTPRKLEVSLKALEEGADVVYHDLWVKPDRGWIIKCRAKGRRLRTPVFMNLLTCGNALMNSTVVTRRHLLEAVGPIDEDPEVVASEDFDCWLRISRLTERFAYIPECLGYYWAGGESISSRDMSKNYLAVIQKYRHLMNPEQMDAVEAFAAYTRACYHLVQGKFEDARADLRTARTHPDPVLRTKACLKSVALQLRRMLGCRELAE